jgi:hypothetical protein
MLMNACAALGPGENPIRILTLIVLVTTIAGCQQQVQSRHSTDSQAVTVGTPQGLDSGAKMLAASSTPVASPAPVTSDTAPSVHFSSPKDSLCGEVAENGILIPNTRRTAVAAQLGRPDSAVSQPAPNPHNPAQTDTVVDVFYPGLRLHYWVVAANQAERDIILEIDISDNRYLKYPSVGIGANAEALVNGLGERGERTEDGYRYSCALHVMSGADMGFHFADGRVKWISYRYYVD